MRDQLEDLRAKTYRHAQDLLDTAKKEKRDLNGAENLNYQKIMDDLEAQRSRINRMDDEERTAERANRALGELMHRGSTAYLSADDRELNDEFRRVINERSNKPVEITMGANEMRSGFQPGLEQRDLVTTSGSGMVGTTFYGRLQRHLVESSAILSAGATVIQTDSGEPLKVPKTTALSAAAIVSEAGAIGESDPTLGSVTLGSYKYGFLVQVSTELAQDANFDILGYLAEQSGIAVGNAFGAHAITGTGSSQPSGIVTGATLGVTGPTGTATSLGTHTTAGQGGDLLLDLAASLPEPYSRSRSSAWLMRNATLNAIRKLRDSTGNYVFSTDIIPGSGSAGTLLGRPVFTDPNVAAMGASAKSIVFGDISRYWVRQVNGLRFERSDEYAFNSDLVTFRALARLDGALTDTTGAVKYFVHSAT